ncbi:MAG TPA: response regulator [Dehalococcoidia bacterium]|nr:response regulator [Dehalococcoidia bacterium]
MVHALVCDDYEPIANLVKIVLGAAGFVVSTATDGTSALKLIRSIRPDLIISDVDMPGISGICLFKTLRSDTTGMANVPFILMSSVNYKLAALEAGCDYFLTKPFPLDDLRRIVSKALACRQEVRD